MGKEERTGMENGRGVEVEILNSVVWVGLIEKVSHEGRFQGQEGGSHLVSVRMIFQAKETTSAQKACE